MRPVTGLIILILTGAILFTPVPLSNVAPAAVIAVIALARVEGDGLLLAVAVVAACFLICVASATVWLAIVGSDVIINSLRTDGVEIAVSLNWDLNQLVNREPYSGLKLRVLHTLQCRGVLVLALSPELQLQFTVEHPRPLDALLHSQPHGPPAVCVLT